MVTLKSARQTVADMHTLSYRTNSPEFSAQPTYVSHSVDIKLCSVPMISETDATNVRLRHIARQALHTDISSRRINMD